MQSVTIYSTPTCSYCEKAKAFFKEHNVAYTEKDVSMDMRAREEMINKSGQMAVPVIEIDGALILGFNKPALHSALMINS